MSNENFESKLREIITDLRKYVEENHEGKMEIYLKKGTKRGGIIGYTLYNKIRK